MTDYTALANRLLRLGILTKVASDMWSLTGEHRDSATASVICHDGRVVLAAMNHPQFHYAIEQDERGHFVNGKPHGRRANDPELAVAILTACCDALEAQQ